MKFLKEQRVHQQFHFHHYKQACDRGIFEKLELDIESPAGPTLVGAEEKTLFLHPLGCWEMHFPKSEKHSIINKSTTFATFYHPYPEPLTFESFLHKFQQ